MPIGVGAALLISGVAGAGASVATNVYSTKRAGSLNDKALAAQERSENADRQLGREAMAADKQRWADYIASRQPYVQASQQAYKSLLDLAGGGGAPSPPPQSAGVAAPSAPPPPAGVPSLMDVAGGPPPPPAQSRGRVIAARVPQMTMPPPQPAQGPSLFDLARMAAMSGRGSTMAQA